jgi:bifunctional ADP-heptose synthase (sugar kinase/adenylyltransferase)
LPDGIKGERMKVGIIGDNLIDRNWVGTLGGLSAEVPVPVVKIHSVFDQPGGAGNVRACLRALGVDAVCLARTDVVSYPVKNRLFVGVQQIARWDQTDYCQPFQVEDLLVLADCDGIVVSDYGKGSVSPEVVEVLRETTLPLFVDTKADPSPWIGSQAVLFPNQKEFDLYKEKYAWINKVVLKQGEAGVTFLEYGHPVLRRPSVVEGLPLSVCGAGDAVLAGFVNCWLAGCNLDYCLEFSMASAAVVCGKPFTATATWDEVQQVLGRRDV